MNDVSVRKNYFRRISGRDSFSDCYFWNLQKLSPLHDGHNFSVCGVSDVVSTISALLFLRSPPAIAWLVVAIIVDSIKRVIGGWARPNVMKKIQETFPPSFTNRYSSPAIQQKPVICFYMASGDHPAPNAMLWGVAHFVLYGVRVNPASARLLLPPYKMPSDCVSYCSAITFAFPNSGTGSILPGSFNNQ